MGAFVLASVAPYFPKGTIHVAVVDPAVGTRRLGILVITKHASYVGPDNGLLMLAAQRHGILDVHELTNRKFMLPRVSHTFHGRDVFAPVSAYLANGSSPAEFGPKINQYVVPKFAKPILKANILQGEIVHIDDFGNIITNLTKKDLKRLGLKPTELLLIKMKNKSLRVNLCNAYGEAVSKGALALIDSHGFLEVAINQGNAAEKFQMEAGDAIAVRGLGNRSTLVA
jgi:S-adenosylmethionine hydrolase